MLESLFPGSAMADKKPSVVPTPAAGPLGASASDGNDREEHAVSIHVERFPVEFSSELATADGESQTQSAASSARKELQSSLDTTSTSSGSSSHEVVTVSSTVASKWRWIGQKELQYLVTNRRTPPPRPDDPAKAIELGHESKSSSTGTASVDAASDALEKGAFVRVVTEGAGIPAALEGASEGGRQRIAHILLPTAEESPERNETGNPPQPPLPNGGKSFLLTAAAAETAAVAGGKKRKVSSAVAPAPERNNFSLKQDLEKGKVCNETTDGDGDSAGESTSGYHHEGNDDDDPLCRVCHMSTSKADAISLGCACKLDLGRAHRTCAETWFQVRGSRQCEICGEIAQNVQLLEPMEEGPTNNQDTVIIVNARHPASACWQNRPIRNFLIVFLVAAFLVPWLFRFAYYRS